MICWSRWASEAAVSTYVRSTMTIEPTTKSVEYHSVSVSGHRYLADDIADTAYGLQQFFLERPIDPVAEPAHQDIDDIGLRIEVVLPDVREDHRFRDDLAGIPHQIFQQREFPRAQVECGASARHLARQEIQRQVVHGETRRLRRAARPAHERLHAREQLGEGKWLREIVVAACLQAADPVVD